MDSSEDTYRQMMEGLFAGDPKSFRQLVALHKNRVLNTCYRFVQDPADAEDLAQDTFVEVYRSLTSFRGESDIATWIYRIAVTKSLDHIRKRDREKRGGTLRKLLGTDSSTVDIPGPHGLQPDAALEERERRRVLNQALSKLPKRQRVAFVLSAYDGLSYQEVAHILNTSISSVESLIHRARRNLQARLQTYYRMNP